MQVKTIFSAPYNVSNMDLNNRKEVFCHNYKQWKISGSLVIPVYRFKGEEEYNATSVIIIVVREFCPVFYIDGTRYNTTFWV